jgi:hypothetical protein
VSNMSQYKEVYEERDPRGNLVRRRLSEVKSANDGVEKHIIEERASNELINLLGVLLGLHIYYKVEHLREQRLREELAWRRELEFLRHNLEQLRLEVQARVAFESLAQSRQALELQRKALEAQTQLEHKKIDTFASLTREEHGLRRELEEKRLKAAKEMHSQSLGVEREKIQAFKDLKLEELGLERAKLLALIKLWSEEIHLKDKELDMVKGLNQELLGLQRSQFQHQREIEWYREGREDKRLELDAQKLQEQIERESQKELRKSQELVLKAYETMERLRQTGEFQRGTLELKAAELAEHQRSNLWREARESQELRLKLIRIAAELAKLSEEERQKISDAISDLVGALQPFQQGQLPSG